MYLTMCAETDVEMSSRAWSIKVNNVRSHEERYQFEATLPRSHI